MLTTSFADVGGRMMVRSDYIFSLCRVYILMIPRKGFVVSISPGVILVINSGIKHREVIKDS